jgi:hypothetical protein
MPAGIRCFRQEIDRYNRIILAPFKSQLTVSQKSRVVYTNATSIEPLRFIDLPPPEVQR